MSDMEIDDECVVSTEEGTQFEWISYVAVPFVGKVLKCINGNPVEWVDDFPKVQEQSTNQEQEPLTIKTPGYDESDFWKEDSQEDEE